MAAAGDGDIGEAEAARTTTSRRTIHDYLGEGEDGDEASPPSPETPPRLWLPRFTCARIRFGRKRGGSRGVKEAAAAEESGGASSMDSSSGARRARGSSKQAAETTPSGGTGSVATAAQTGMGLSMLLLLARTCVELNRMAEVRAQMEALLKEIRDEASRVKGAADHAVVTPKTCNNLQSSSTTTASSSCVSGTSTNCLEIGRGEDGKRTSGDEGRAGIIDALEAEFGTAEPARRQPPEWKRHTEQETPECSMQSSSDDEFIELEGGRFGGGGGGGGHSDDGSDDDDGSSSRERDEGGVSAIELEQRLHELRHRRDRERITALESALRRAERMLTEKEMEARLWQDTAALALGQPAPRDDDDGQ